MSKRTRRSCPREPPGTDLGRGLASLQRAPADRPIEQAGIEMGQPEMGGEPLGDGALARRGRAFDRDDEARHALGARRSSGAIMRLMAHRHDAPLE